MIRPTRTDRARWISRRAFTLTEILVVIVIIAILVGLLLPAINGAVRAARNSGVLSEINLMAQALESFKAKYGDYPPSRVILSESGYYNVGNTTPIAPGDITYGMLAQRTLSAFRKMFPKAAFSTSGVVWPSGSTVWYDFNGNGVYDQNPYMLQGHECLVFFLGGIPLPDPSGTFGLTGFGKDPVNPFTNSITASPMYNPNRQPPLFEFNPGRLYLDPGNTSLNGVNPGIPAYYDSLGNSIPGAGSGTLNFYVYFSSYGNGNYDPNDVNFANWGSALSGYVSPESDANLASPIGLQFRSLTASPNISPSPNPYSATLTITATGTVNFQKPQTFQILSSGADGLYGVGGQFLGTATTASQAASPLPWDSNHTYAGSALTTDGSIRFRERDNLTNFKTSTLD